MFNAKPIIDRTVFVVDATSKATQTVKSELKTEEKYEPIKALGSLIRNHYPTIICVGIAVASHIIANKIVAENNAIIVAISE